MWETSEGEALAGDLYERAGVAPSLRPLSQLRSPDPRRLMQHCESVSAAGIPGFFNHSPVLLTELSKENGFGR